ncbi:hypothetical protein LTR64_007063 [Lithohypha guttulata]|uniref:uncharacterized protein n=1 Tax=Lithohypha guttulata TaxID=1690604 RepID=UPI002DDF5713|nr:hypothetical protein LTR51_004381 [Lithohypha guttulata]
MPGKYSHSVVLADYSTRGLIVLPPDQHDKYLESAPKPQKKPHHEQQRPRSAQAIYKPPTSTVEGWESLLAEKPNTQRRYAYKRISRPATMKLGLKHRGICGITNDCPTVVLQSMWFGRRRPKQHINDSNKESVLQVRSTIANVRTTI